jgi:hypothetical protein
VDRVTQWSREWSRKTTGFATNIVDRGGRRGYRSGFSKLATKGRKLKVGRPARRAAGFPVDTANQVR